MLPGCNLCTSQQHEDSVHYAEILAWLAEDSHQGDTSGRMYYAYKRREKKNYPGLIEDVWWMMNHPPQDW